ncbi:MAG: leucyl/phenylalanyl-tRNA--protein transferase [Nitrospirae bacterium]|nr:MAG: leucyl/phenylalanyl-tRNA--protein transferase [Nitrospirota bacterium]
MVPIFYLTEELVFPPPELAEYDGLLAVGGDLSPERLLLAYREGIFPWFTEDTEILWWSPEPRLVLFPEELKVSRSLRQVIKKETYRVSFDKAFSETIRLCARVHRQKDGDTWITESMVEAYIRLHELGYAHSVEAWHEGRLVGGLYGVSLGRAFFGESMFTLMPNASKVAFVFLVKQIKQWGFNLVDCQVTTEHLKRFGAREIKRAEFLRLLKDSLNYPTRRGRWRLTLSAEDLLKKSD